MTRRPSTADHSEILQERRPRLRVAPKRMRMLDGPGTVVGVTSIQVKHVPDDVHQILRERASRAGQSLQEYLLARITADARTPTVNEVLDRVAATASDHHPPLSATDALRMERAER